MKIGDPVRTPIGIGIYKHNLHGLLGVEADGHLAFWPSLSVLPYTPTSQVDAVVGEQAVAILERLRDALGVGSIGEVEAAVMGMFGKAET